MTVNGSPLVLSGWAKTVVHALDRLGADSDAVLQATGVTRDAFDREEELPIAVTTRLWQEAAKATGDPAFGLKASRYVQPAALQGLAYAVQASSTVRDAIERFDRYSRVVSDAASLRLEETNQSLRLCFELAESADTPSYEAMDAILSTIVRGLRVLTEGTIAIQGVVLRRPEPVDPRPFHRFFGVEVSFGEPLDILELPLSELDQPLPYANAELALQNDKAVASYLRRLGPAGVVDRTRIAVLQELPSGEVTLASIAKSMATSPRSLQRELSEAGTTFADIFDSVREDLAREYLTTGDHSTAEIAFLLGFADASGFSRAFKRWTGESPGAVRAKSRPKAQPAPKDEK